MSAGLHTVGIILAAGQSKRMGAENKLLMPWQDKPLLAHVLEAVQRSALSRVVVVTGHEREKIDDLVGQCGIGLIETVHNPDFESGMASSLAKAASTIGECDGVMILLGDMPLVTSAHLDAMLDAFDRLSGRSIVVATHKEKWGNPVLFPHSFIPNLKTAVGDRGARKILMDHEKLVVGVEIGEAASRDFDTKDMFEQFSEDGS